MRTDDRDEIRAVFEEIYPQNIKSKNRQGYGEMYTESALWMPPGQPDRLGIDDILEGFTLLVSQADIDPIFTADEIEVMGDFGYIIGIALATIHPKDGSPSYQIKYRALWLMKKDEGCWKIDRQIWKVSP